MAEIQNSTFFDMTSYQLVSDDLFQQLRTVSPTDLNAIASIFQQAFYARASPDVTVSVVDATSVSAAQPLYLGLTLDRATNPAELLKENWATRQHAIADQTAVANTYGTNQGVYDTVSAAVAGIVAAGGGSLVPNYTGTGSDITPSGYVSTAQSRTIWLELTPQSFEDLFHTPLLQVTAPGWGTYYAWAGNLSIDDSIHSHLDGIWVQEGIPANALAAAETHVVPLDADDPASAPGILGPGNGANVTGAKVTAAPSAVADAYHFPLDGSVQTPTIALVEGHIASYADLFAYINQYRVYMGHAPYTQQQFQVVWNSVYGATGADPAEIDLDISILADAVPTSSQVLYSNNGDTYFTSYQQAIFDLINRPSIISSSYPEDARFSPDSPFQRAYYELFVDAQLRNISVFLSAGDGGSQSEYATGAPLVRNTHGIPNAVIVGGTSIAPLSAAENDATLATIVAQAKDNDPATLFALTAAGLSALPSHLSSSVFQTFTEAVWNVYYLNPEGTWNPALFENASLYMQPDYTGNEAGTGGVDSTWDAPAYQIDFGLNLVSAGPNPRSGRGNPDVAALAGGDSWYEVLNSNYTNGSSSNLTHGSGGTSAATPLWAALTAQLDAVFHDQGLPYLGYYNDLLYIAAAIAPGAFNDITIGNNVSTYYLYDGTTPVPDDSNVIYAGATGDLILPTGIGYYAEAGYDLTTGLGSPNGLLLARALSWIAHSQMNGPFEPDVVTAQDAVTARSDASQSLLVQTSGDLGAFRLTAGSLSYEGVSDSAALAWTSRLAGQVLQQDFDADLVRLLDGAAQGGASTLHVNAGDTLSAAMHGTALGLYQTALTSPYGFAAFGGLDAGITVARPVAVAQMASDPVNHTAVVRMRQNGEDDVSVSFYKVDDLSGTIDGVAPGHAGYAALAAGNAYHTSEGGTSVEGPGWGSFVQTELTDVHSGDIIAMTLTNGANTYWAFADANEIVDGAPVTHLWSYGLNTWGWEDLYGGGDHDYNDLVVQLDFTSTAGSGFLI